MKIGSFEFNRLEFSGSLGDMGTLIPLLTALIVVTGVGASPALFLIGIFYISTGLYYKLPIPVQPLKVVSAVAVAYPAMVTLPVLSAAGIMMGALLIFLSISGLLNKIAQLFKKPVIRGVQFGLGVILFEKGAKLIFRPELFFSLQTNQSINHAEYIFSANMFLGIIGFFIVLFLLNQKKYPAALVIMVVGIIAGLIFGKHVDFQTGPTPVSIIIPELSDFKTALGLLVLPQIPLTLGNAVIGTRDACITFFGEGEKTKKATNRAFAISMGLFNLSAGFFGAMPMCHGAGGLAAHYRFGARTGGANLMIGAVFIFIAFFLGKTAVHLLSVIPNAILGVLLIFAGLELILMIIDVKNRRALFVVLITGLTGYVADMGLAFLFGMTVYAVINYFKLKI